MKTDDFTKDCEDSPEEIAQPEPQPEKFNLNRISDGRPKCRITPGRQRFDEAGPAGTMPLPGRAFSKTV